MMKIEFYDPEMCCSSGVCGPSPDPDLIRTTKVIEQLKNSGHTVNRYMMSRTPIAFSSNEAVYKELLSKGPKILPMVFVDGRVVCAGRYPSLDEMLAAAQ